MNQKPTPERLDELAGLYLQRYRVENVDYGQMTLQRLACAILDAQVMINLLGYGWFTRKMQDREVVGGTSKPGNEFVVKDVAELAGFLSALHAAVSEEYQRRLSEFM